MTYLRKKIIKGKTYYYVVKGVYNNTGKLNQKVVKYLGSIDNILAKFDFWEKNN